MKRIIISFVLACILVFCIVLLSSFTLLSSNARMIVNSQPNQETCFNTVQEDNSGNPVSFTIRKCKGCVKVYFLSASDSDHCAPEN